MYKINVNCKVEDCLHYIRYVLEFFNSHPLLPEGNVFVLNEPQTQVQIDYGIQESKEFYIPCQGLIFGVTVIDNSDIVCNEYMTDTESLFSIESDKKEASPFIRNLTFGFDILETAFFHISRYEEYHCAPSNKDKWDMMWEEQQILVKNGLYQFPVVDQLVFALFQNIGLQPKKRKTSFSLSHDIDVIQKFKTPIRIFRSSVRALLDHGVTGFLNHLKTVIGVWRNTQKDPYDTFNILLIDSSTNYFNNQILYLMAGGLTEKDNYYQINDKKITSVIKKAKYLGYEIGLHGSYATHKNGVQFKKEIDSLAKATKQSINRNRQHFLHFDFHMTPKILENSGIEIDSSLGYQRLIGFRCGTGFSYRLFDFEQKQAYKWKEQPMVIMDGALLSEAANSMQAAHQILDSFIEKNQYYTHITINVHNSIFDPSKRNIKEMKSLYSKMIFAAKKPD